MGWRSALGWAVGRARVLAPIALVARRRRAAAAPGVAGAAPAADRRDLPVASIMLALAAGTLGVSSGATEEQGAPWTSAFLQAHGGVAGEALYQASHRLVQDVGVDILVVFLFLVGVILLTGASLASAIRATGSGVADTTRMLRARRPRRLAPRRPSLLQSAEPARARADRRATHVAAPSLDGADRAREP